jgi:hypothetical protein
MGSVHARGDTFFNFWFKSAYRNEHLTPRHWYLCMCSCMCRLGGVAVSVLATGPKGCGFKTRLRRWIFKGDTNPQHTVVPCRKILRHVKELLKSHRDE